jgi:hypothetical protein
MSSIPALRRPNKEDIMRIAVLIIALCLTALISAQSCAIYVGAGVAKNKELSGGGAVGILVALLFLLGAAFALGMPRVSLVIFGIAAALGIMAGSTTEYHDMTVWGGVALVLAVMSYFGVRELRKKQKATPQG